jgi:hypothetical protein
MMTKVNFWTLFIVFLSQSEIKRMLLSKNYDIFFDYPIILWGVIYKFDKNACILNFF